MSVSNFYNINVDRLLFLTMAICYDVTLSVNYTSVNFVLEK